MSWNDGYERKKHQEELDKEIELLRLNGNTESEINSWIEESWKGYRITRWHAMHMQSINITYFDDQNDETDNPLLRKFLDVMSVTEEYKDSAEFGWMESIENVDMYNMPTEDFHATGVDLQIGQEVYAETTDNPSVVFVEVGNEYVPLYLVNN